MQRTTRGSAAPAGGDTGDDGAAAKRLVPTIHAVLESAESWLYACIAAVLVLACGVLVALAGRDLWRVVDDFSQNPVIEVLDTLLLLFILVELLSAVRITIAKRELVAEPFLLVGIIASIKEIVILSVKAADDIGKGSLFRDQLWEIGVLSVGVLFLGGTAWLLRLKEREPPEGDAAAGLAA